MIKILKNGIEKKIKGITFDGSPTPPCSIPFPVYSKNRSIRFSGLFFINSGHSIKVILCSKFSNNPMFLISS